MTTAQTLGVQHIRVRIGARPAPPAPTLGVGWNTSPVAVGPTRNQAAVGLPYDVTPAPITATYPPPSDPNPHATVRNQETQRVLNEVIHVPASPTITPRPRNQVQVGLGPRNVGAVATGEARGRAQVATGAQDGHAVATGQRRGTMVRTGSSSGRAVATGEPRARAQVATGERHEGTAVPTGERAGTPVATGVRKNAVQVKTKP